MQIRHVFDNFDADRALTSHDIHIIKGRDRRQAVAACQAFNFLLRVVLRSADDANVGTEGADGFDLVCRDERGHADRGGNAEFARGIGDSAAVIARRGGDEATPA